MTTRQKPDYLTTQVLLLCDLTERYAQDQRRPGIAIIDRLRPCVRARFDRAKRRLDMAAPGWRKQP